MYPHISGGPSHGGFGSIGYPQMDGGPTQGGFSFLYPQMDGGPLHSGVTSEYPLNPSARSSLAYGAALMPSSSITGILASANANTPKTRINIFCK